MLFSVIRVWLKYLGNFKSTKKNSENQKVGIAVREKQRTKCEEILIPDNSSAEKVGIR
jgi:hypothetical protein